MEKWKAVELPAEKPGDPSSGPDTPTHRPRHCGQVTVPLGASVDSERGGKGLTLTHLGRESGGAIQPTTTSETKANVTQAWGCLCRRAGPLRLCWEPFARSASPS